MQKSGKEKVHSALFQFRSPSISTLLLLISSPLRVIRSSLQTREQR